KWSLPDQREPKLASVEGKIGFFGITNCNAARTGALDKMAVNEGFIAGHQLHFALHQSRRQTCLLAAREIGPDGSDWAMGISLENVNPRALAFRPETRHARAGAERCRVNQVVGEPFPLQTARHQRQVHGWNAERFVPGKYMARDAGKTLRAH